MNTHKSQLASKAANFCAFQIFGKADYEDTLVDKNGYCVPYNCPLVIKIHSPDFKSTALNGYYVINYPPAFQSKVEKVMSYYLPKNELINF